MRSDNDIKQDVDAELKWNPEVDSIDIATQVTDGAVTLYGFARNYHERHQAELSVKRIIGVARWPMIWPSARLPLIRSLTRRSHAKH